MIVTVEIDLTLDRPLIATSNTDPRLAAMLDLHAAMPECEAETYLEMIGKYLWNRSQFVAVLVDLCGDELYAFNQSEALLFRFQTGRDSAYLFKTASHAPQAIRIIEPRLIAPKVVFDL